MSLMLNQFRLHYGNMFDISQLPRISNDFPQGVLLWRGLPEEGHQSSSSGRWLWQTSRGEIGEDHGVVEGYQLLSLKQAIGVDVSRNTPFSCKLIKSIS